MSTSVKIQNDQVKKISKLLKDEDLPYRSRNDFVVQAVQNEIRLATFKNGLSSMGKYHFDLLLAEGIKNAYERAMKYDRSIPNSPSWNRSKEFREKVDLPTDSEWEAKQILKKDKKSKK